MTRATVQSWELSRRFQGLCATILVALVSILGLALFPSRALADATPVQVVLTYLDGISTWGPKTASGVAEIIRAEGEARVSVRGLTPRNGVHYVLWLGREGADDVFRVGETAIQSDGTATLDIVLPDEIPNRGWNLAFISAEGSADVSHPGAHRVLAGRFPKPLPQGTIPLGLPNTGLGGAASRQSPVPIVAVGATFGAAVLFRRRVRRANGKAVSC